MSWSMKRLLLVVTILIICVPSKIASAQGSDLMKRMVLVELYTSQGCDMCPTAEKVLGALAGRDQTIVPIAFHVDYFNDPWKDVFSDSLYSQRQMTYNQLYAKPKNAEYGLYYTPMMMIDGEQSVNGRDAASAESAIRRARAKKPAVAIDLRLELKQRRRSGTATVRVTSQATRGEGTALALCRSAGRRRRYRRAIGRKRPSRWWLASRRGRRNSSSSSSTASCPCRTGFRL